MDGGATDLDSIWREDDAPELLPPSDEAIDAIDKAIADPQFMRRLVAFILRHAHGHNQAQYLGFTMGTSLPGGMCAQELAMELLGRVMTGKRPWNMEEKPDFLMFCKMHARGMISNLFELMDTQRRESQSPIEEFNAEGDLIPSHVTGNHAEKEDGAVVQGRAEFNQLADQFLDEFALSLDDESTEQKIIMAFIDNKDSVKDPRGGSNELLVFDREYMTITLEITGKEFDAGLKRLQRAHRVFLPKWLGERKTTSKELGGMLYGN